MSNLFYIILVQFGLTLNNRENLLSPNGKELVFGINTEKIVEIKKLKLELDELIQDITEELNKSFKKMESQFIYS